MYVTKGHWTGSVCSLVGISSMHSPALILPKLFWGGGHKYDSYVLFILAKKSNIIPNGFVQKAYLVSLQRLQTSLATILPKWPSMCFLGLVWSRDYWL